MTGLIHIASTPFNSVWLETLGYPKQEANNV